MKPIIHLLIVIMLFTMCIFILPEKSLAGDSKITVTFAGATVIGGVYVLFSWGMSDDFKGRLPLTANSAFINHDSKGWYMGLPDLKLNEHHSHITPYVKVLKIHF